MTQNTTHGQTDPLQRIRQIARQAAQTSPERKLHIGGVQPKEGWEIFNIAAGEHVDHTGDASDCSRFDNNTFTTIYASHILEHIDYAQQLESTLREWHRILTIGGTLMLSVPDLQNIAEALTKRTDLTLQDRFYLMRVIMGGHTNRNDYHYTAFTPDILSYYLLQSGFESVTRRAPFGIFKDCSALDYKGIQISLNIEAKKTAVSARR
jgi:predicted SAM-dependent methyltransferase